MRLFNRTSHRTLWLAALAIAASVTPSSHGDVIAQWRFDEDPGADIAADSIGAADGTLSGSAEFVAGGVLGNAISVTIAGDGFVDMGDNFAFDTGSFSIVMWVQTAPNDQSPDKIVLARHRSTIIAGYLIGVNTNGPYGETDKAWFYQSTGPGGELTSNASVNDGDWHQVVVSYQAGSTVSIYIDGAPVDNSRPSSPIGFIDAPFVVGGLDYSGTLHGTFNGRVDELQLYDHAVTSDEAQYLFEHPDETVCPADLNGDGERGQPDLGLLLASYGVDDGGDIDGDGDTDQSDLGFLLSVYGVPCP